MKQTILIISRDKTFVDSIKNKLSDANYNVITTQKPSVIESTINEENMILSIIDGSFLEFEKSEFISSLRNISCNFPIIALYKHYNENLILKAFKEGADDCITSQCNFKIFLARVKNLFRRYYHNYEIIRHKEITYFSENNCFYIDNKMIDFTKLEKMLFLEFLKNKETLLSRNTLIKNVWNDNSNIQHKTVNVSIQRLREKLMKYTGQDYIQTINGQGYMFF